MRITKPSQQITGGARFSANDKRQDCSQGKTSESMNLTVHLRIHFPNNQEQEKLHHQKIGFRGGAESSFHMLLMSESQMPVTVLNLKDTFLMNQ